MRKRPGASHPVWGWRLVVALLLFSIGAAGVASCESGTNSSPYPVYKSGVRVSAGSRIFWLDKHRVIFHGRVTEAAEVEVQTETFSEDKRGALIWDLDTNRLRQLTDSYMGFCYRDGYVQRSIVDDRGQRILVGGSIGGEAQPLPIQPQEIDPTEYTFNKLSCRWGKTPGVHGRPRLDPAVAGAWVFGSGKSARK